MNQHRRHLQRLDQLTRLTSALFNQLASVRKAANDEAKDYDLLVCPKCSKGIEPVILDFYQDPRDAQEYQKFCWVCPGVEEGSCTFPLDIPTEVFWCRRTRAQAEENILPLPNINLLPEQFRHLYPSIFLQRSTTPPSLPHQQQQQLEAVVTEERSPGASPSPPKIEVANVATHLAPASKKRQRKPRGGASMSRAKAELVDNKPQQFYTAPQLLPAPSIVASNLPGMYDHLPPQDFKEGLPLTLPVTTSNNTARHLLLLPDGQTLRMPPPEMSLKEALQSPLYQDYLTYATQLNEEREELVRFHHEPAMGYGMVGQSSETPRTLTAAATSKKALKKGKIITKNALKRDEGVGSLETVHDRVSKQLQSRMGRSLQDRPIATQNHPNPPQQLFLASPFCPTDGNPAVEQWKVGALTACSRAVSHGSGHQTTISTSLQTRPGSAATSSTNSSYDRPRLVEGETRRKRLNTQIGVEGGVGVFGGEPAEESFGDSYIDQLVHEKYKARLMASKRREAKERHESVEERRDSKTVGETATPAKAVDIEEPRLVDRYGYAVRCGSIVVHEPEDPQLDCYYAGEPNINLDDNFPEGPTSDDDLFDFEF